MQLPQLAALALLALSHGASASADVSQCVRNACLSVVKGNKAAPSSLARAGCTSYFKSTVTPSIVTKTSTQFAVATVSGTLTVVNLVDATATSTTIISTTSTSVASQTLTVTRAPEDPFKRAAADVAVAGKSCPTAPAPPSSIPTYATAACTDSVAYSSACSCISAIHSTVTLAPCTTHVVVTRTRTTSVTSTVQAYSTTTVTTVPATNYDISLAAATTYVATSTVCEPLETPASFYLRAESEDGSIQYQYLQLADSDPDDDTVIMLAADMSTAGTWTINSDGYLESTDGRIAEKASGDDDGNIFVYNIPSDEASGFALGTGTVYQSPTSCLAQLGLQIENRNLFYICYGAYLGLTFSASDPEADGCIPVTVYVEDAGSS